MNLPNMIRVSLFTAIMGVLAFFPPITLPLIPVPITAQSLGVMLAGGILGAKRGGLSLLLFVFLVAIGVPLLAGGRGGLSVLVGPSGGYIYAWPFASFIIGFLIERIIPHLKFWSVFLINVFGGIIIVYIVGVTHLALISNTPWLPTAFSSLTFLPGDLLKALIATYVTIKLYKAYPLIGENKHG